MIAQPRTSPSQLDGGYDPYLTDPNAPVEPVNSTPPKTPTQPAPTPTPTSGGMGGSGIASTISKLSAPTTNGTPPLPTTLPDGGGGVVPVPPPQLAPPKTVTPTPVLPTPSIPVSGGIGDAPPPGPAPEPILPPYNPGGVGDAPPPNPAPDPILPSYNPGLNDAPPPTPPSGGLGGSGIASTISKLSAPTTNGTPPLPTALPDGGGGVVPGLNDAPPPWLPPLPAPPINSARVGTAADTPMDTATSGRRLPPGVSINQVTPDQNIINTQVTPGADPRLLKFQGDVSNIINRMANGPNRFDLAKQYYDAWEQPSAIGYQHELQDATDEAAAHGRIGSGLLTNTYGDLAAEREATKRGQRGKFLTDALTGTINDTRDTFNALNTAEQNAFGEGQANRNEFRTEREYQRSQAEQALLNRIRQQQAEAGLSAQDFAQGADLYGMGNTGDPTATYENAAGQSALEAAAESGDVGALLRLLAMSGQTVPTSAYTG